MKRFWSTADAVPADGGWGIVLDGRPVRTPARRPLKVPTETLGTAIAEEWRFAEESVDPKAMPMTGLANAAIDRIADDPAGYADSIARYAQSELACYRADGPSGLIQRQAERWDALLAWARRRFDVDFAVTTGVIPVEQPAATVQQLRHAVAALDPFRLAALTSLVTIGGSLLAGLAVLERQLGAEQAWDAVTVDDAWQIAQWGGDQEAVAALDNRRADFLAAARFLELLG